VCIKSSRLVATDTAVERDLAPVSVVTAVLLSLEFLRVSVLLPQEPSIPEIFQVMGPPLTG
jgi:hypothetical protein